MEGLVQTNLKALCKRLTIENNPVQHKFVDIGHMESVSYNIDIIFHSHIYFITQLCC